MLNKASHKHASCRRQRGGGALGAYTGFIRFPSLINLEHKEWEEGEGFDDEAHHCHRLFSFSPK